MVQSTHGGDVAAAAACFGLAPEDIVDFSASLNPLGPPAGVRTAIRAGLRGTGRAASPLLSAYPDPASRAAREHLAKHLGLLPEEVLLTNGGAEAIHLVVRWWARQGSGSSPGRVVLPAPSFSEYARAARAAGAGVRFLTLDPASGFAWRPEALAARLRAGDLLFLANPNNPTGTAVDGSTIASLAALVDERGAFLAVDEAFLPFLPDDRERSAVPMVRRMPRMAVVGSLTKFYCLPGIRVGYAAACAATVAGLEAHQPPWSVNGPAQAAVPCCLADSAYAVRTRRLIARERRRLELGLSRVPGLRVFPGAANFLLVDCRGDGRTGAQWRLLLGRRGLLIRDCGDFPGLDPYYFRVAVRRPAENALLLAAIRELAGTGRG